VLHGLGADGTDFLPLADEMDLSAVGPVRWVFPRAPVRR
jgi:phospholipase/carboxylesterase